MATQAHCCYVFDILESRLSKRAAKTLSAYQEVLKHDPTALAPDSRHPLFVTYNTLRPGKDKRLRGCIGTFAANPLEDTLKHYALVAALQDTRFSPITVDELKNLEAAVSILTDFEGIDDPYDWSLGKHGLQVHFMYKGRGRSATFLPDVAPEQGWSQDDTLEHLFRKGGWDGAEHKIEHFLSGFCQDSSFVRAIQAIKQERKACLAGHYYMVSMNSGLDMH